MVDKTHTATNSREDLLSFLHQENDKVQKQLVELQALIEQTHNEVERLQQKNAMVTNRIHQIEANFDSVPRQDIRVAYNEAMDTRNRLLTMRGNLEKLQSDQAQLQVTSMILTKVLGQIEGLAPAAFAGSSASSVAESSPAAANIVRVIEAQETERQRLARQMHDGPAQSLTNFILQAEICQRLFDRNPDRAAEELNNLKTVATGTFQKIRDFIFDLRPMMLDDLGLIPTLRRYGEAYQEKSEMTVNMHILGDERRLESHREVILFRSIQELLNNAREHAKASNVTVTLDMGQDIITATVEDNGQGFNSDNIFAAQDEAPQADDKSLSLKTLRERLEMVGGALDVNSEEGRGSRIMARIPAGQPPNAV